jgi:Protein of unknown function (DUF3429)
LKFDNQKMALALMISGALPFVAAAIMSVLNFGDVRGVQGDQIAVAYGAVILSFLGGIRWGDAIAKGVAITLFVSVLPSLAGFFSLLINSYNATMILIAGFAAQAIWDFIAPGTLPVWFIKLRMVISAIVVACLTITLLY